MNHHVLKLSKPVTVAGVTVTELKLRNEVVAGDLRGIKLAEFVRGLPVDDVLTIGGRLSGQTAAVMNGLSFQDLSELTGAIGGFLGLGPETGTTASP